MQSAATTIEQYMAELPEDRKAAMEKLYKVFKKQLPKGFKDTMQYGMISFVIPHSKYPAGYHCNPKDALPFLSIASQKNFIAVYHMMVYSDAKLHKWFSDEYAKLDIGKLDMGKSCIRFKKLEKIPYELMGELAAKVTPDEWIKRYEEILKKGK